MTPAPAAPPVAPRAQSLAAWIRGHKAESYGVGGAAVVGAYLYLRSRSTSTSPAGTAASATGATVSGGGGYGQLESQIASLQQQMAMQTAGGAPGVTAPQPGAPAPGPTTSGSIGPVLGWNTGRPIGTVQYGSSYTGPSLIGMTLAQARKALQGTRYFVNAANLPAGAAITSFTPYTTGAVDLGG